MNQIKLRPHHLKLLCGYLHDFNLVRQQCKDNKYSNEFLDGIYQLCQKIAENPDLEVKIIQTRDDICSLCLERSPKSSSENCFSPETNYEEWDCAPFYNVKINNIYSSKNLLENLKNSLAYLQSEHISQSALN